MYILIQSKGEHALTILKQIQMHTTTKFLSMAFEGKARNVLEACVAGGFVGVSLSAFKSSMVDPEGSFDSRLDKFQYLVGFDPDVVFQLTNLLRVVTLFVPSMVSKTLLMAEYLDDLAACAEASATDAKRFPGVMFTAYVLVSRITRIISDLTISFPYDSPSRLKVEESAQRLYEYQEAMHAEVRGYARLAKMI
jgi:hypothetical protein